MSVDLSLWKMGVRYMEGEWVHLTLGSDVVFLLKAVRSNNPHSVAYRSLCTFDVCVFVKALSQQLIMPLHFTLNSSA